MKIFTNMNNELLKTKISNARRSRPIKPPVFFSYPIRSNFPKVTEGAAPPPCDDFKWLQDVQLRRGQLLAPFDLRPLYLAGVSCSFHAAGVFAATASAESEPPATYSSYLSAKYRAATPKRNTYLLVGLLCESLTQDKL